MKPQQNVRRPFSDGTLLRRCLEAKSNVVLRTIGVVSLIHGALAAWLFTTSPRPEDLVGPLRCGLLALGLSSVLSMLAHMRRVRGWVAYAILVPFASLPTLFFLTCFMAQPSEAAAYIQGPISYLYFVTVVAAALSFDFWVTFVASLVAAAGFESCLLWAQTHADSTASQSWSELNDPTVPDLKVLLLITSGFLVAIVIMMVRRTAFEVLAEARMEQHLGRLFGRYIRESARERLLYEPSAYEGERRDVVVLCAELTGLNELSRSTGSQQLVEQLNTYFEAMVRSITLRGGAIDSFIGDTLVATFGGMAEVEAPCVLAIEAAREMRFRLALLNASWGARGRERFDNRIALHAGPVVLGHIGSALNKKFTLIGAPLTTVSGVVSSLPKEQGHPILLTGTVYERLPASMKTQCHSLGTVEVKGHRAPVEVYGLPETSNTAPIQLMGDAPSHRDISVTWK